jgi:hypothetical protein
MERAEFATWVETDQPVVTDRLMSWSRDLGYGSHGERAVFIGPGVGSAPAPFTWYLAEGATHSGFELFYLLQNPSTGVAQARVRYLQPSGAPLEKTYTIAPASRLTIWVNQEEFPDGSGHRALANTEVSAIIEPPRFAPDGSPLPVVTPIIAERAMYRTRPGADPAVPGAMFEAGHASAGVTAPSPSWFFAEGATGTFFDEFLLLANSDTRAAHVQATYLLPNGTTYEKTYTVAPVSRFTIWVDEEEIPAGSGLRPLAQAEAVSATLTSDVPIVAERAMWWPGPTSATWTEAHASVGATTSSLRWAAAAGRVLDSPRREDTYYLVANPTPVAATVRATVFFADGSAPVSRDFVVGASSRLSLDMRSRFPETVGRSFGIVIESLGDSPAPIVVEWAIYSDALGQRWAAGANALATRLP